MSNRSPSPNLAQMFDSVKPKVNTQLPLFSDTVIHHKVLRDVTLKVPIVYKGYGCKTYGVSSSRRVLTPDLLLKKFDYVRDCLKLTLGLTIAEREVVLRLLRYWAYYAYVYPKEASVTEEPGCSKATFWRTVRRLKELGLLTVVNRFLIRPHAQISNLYRFDKLLILVARYLAEHIAHLWPEWLAPYFVMSGREFWGAFAVGGDTS